MAVAWSGAELSKDAFASAFAAMCAVWFVANVCVEESNEGGNVDMLFGDGVMNTFRSKKVM